MGRFLLIKEGVRGRLLLGREGVKKSPKWIFETFLTYIK
jgi:hypothetical protein